MSAGVSPEIRMASFAPLRIESTQSDRGADERCAVDLWAHVVAHQRHWLNFRPGRWRWPGVSPRAVSFALVVSVISLAAWRALVPGDVVGHADIPQTVRDRAVLLFVFCWIPALRYLLQEPKRRRPLPFFATYSCLYSAYYAMAPMFGVANLLMVGGWSASHPINPASEYDLALDVLLLAWVLLVLGYRAGAMFTGRNDHRIDQWLRRLEPSLSRGVAFSFLMVGLAATFLDRAGVVPLAFGGIATFLKLASQAAIVVLIVLARRREIGAAGKVFACAGIAATLFMELGGSATGGVMFLFFSVFTGFWIGGRQVSARLIVIAALALAGCVAIRGVMDRWRATVWVQSRGEVPAIDRSRLMMAMLSDQVSAHGSGGAIAAGWEVIARRSANTDLLIDVMRRTPSQIPYLNGSTYASLVGALVPRFLWPDKPQKSLGQDFGHRYGYIGESDNATSVNLPVLVEFYLNFGLVGVFAGMFLLGVLLRVIEDAINRPGQGYLITAAAAPLLARLLVMECDLSLMFGGLPLQLGALYITALMVLLIGGVLPGTKRALPPWYATIEAWRWGRRSGHAAATARVSGAAIR